MITNGVLTYPNSPAIAFDPLYTNSPITLSGGRLIATDGPVAGISLCDVGKSTGKWYWEIKTTGGTGAGYDIGIATHAADLTGTLGNDPGTISYGYVSFSGTGYKIVGGIPTTYGVAYTLNDVIGVALDLSGPRTITMYVNNVSQGTMFTVGAGTYYPGISSYINGFQYTAHFAAGSFIYSPPSGFIALT